MESVCQRTGVLLPLVPLFALLRAPSSFLPPIFSEQSSCLCRATSLIYVLILMDCAGNNYYSSIPFRREEKAILSQILSMRIDHCLILRSTLHLRQLVLLLSSSPPSFLPQFLDFRTRLWETGEKGKRGEELSKWIVNFLLCFSCTVI